MSLVPSENELRPRDGRDVLSEMQARENDRYGDRSPPVDFLGPLMRRKSIVILFCLIGAAIGYVLYRQELPTYQSGLRIMIWKKSPPTLINGEKYDQAVSLSKEQTLIASQDVIENAIKASKLTELESFRGHPAPFYVLKRMLSVKPVTNSSDTLEITCRGPIADDLPRC